MIFVLKVNEFESHNLRVSILSLLHVTSLFAIRVIRYTIKSSEAMMILVVMNAILANAYIRSRSLKNSGQSPENMEDIIKDSEIFGIQKLSSHQEDAIKYVAA